MKNLLSHLTRRSRDRRSKSDPRQERATTASKESPVKVETKKNSPVDASSAQNPTDILAREASAKIDPTIPFEPQKLWDEAYDALSNQDPGLLKAYERVLNRELNQNLDEEQKNPRESPQANLVQNDDLEMRRSQMKQLVQGGLKKTEKEARLKQNVGGVIDIAKDAITLISVALQACPQAALPLAGVTLAIQLLTNPITNMETNRAGIEYVIKKMNWYWNLSKHLLKEDTAFGTSFADLHSELKTQLVDLYKELLSYQIKSVCSYYQNRGLVVFQDLLQFDDWDGMLEHIRDSEKSLLEGFRVYNDQQIKDHHERDTHLLQSIDESVQAQMSLQREFREDEKYHDCLKDLHLTDPVADMMRIEASKDSLLEKSYVWILSDPNFSQWRTDQKTRLLWIKGNPGKGKTMLLIGINKEMSKQNAYSRLLSFFFCQEPDANLNNATAVLRGLIYRLIVLKPPLVSHVRKEWDKAGSKLFEGRNTLFTLSEIFVNMIRDPSLGYTYLMVDALDECQTDLDHLLKIIVDTSLDPSSRVKWLVSSRHKTSIDSSLNPIEQKIELDLEKDAKDRVSHAVDVYIDDKIGALFQKYINGLDSFGLPEDLMELQNIEHKVAKEVRSMANDTFLWVALVFRQIEKEDYSANEVLEAVREMPTDLDKMYERMMYQIVEQNQHKVKHCKQVLLIMASCYRPLRLAELALLAEIPNLGSPVKIIQLCGIFTMEQNHGVVNFVHQSAKDYLVDYMSPKLSSQIFPSGKEEGHRLIFSNSLNAMSKGLKRNIYNLKRADIHLEEIETPRIDPLASLKYSCVYWTDHLCQMINKIDGALDELDGVERFWEQKSIYWLEALILMKHLAAGMSAITSVLDILEDNKPGSRLFTLMMDTRRFMTANIKLIKTHPLQLYCSALVFSPSGSQIRSFFDKEAPDNMKVYPAMEKGWNACLAQFDSDFPPLKAAWSPDSRRSVVGTEGNTVEVWSCKTGTCLRVLKGHFGPVWAVAFAPNNIHVASGSDDGTVKIWNADTGACLHTFTYFERTNSSDTPFSVWSVAFSPDGSRIAAGSSQGDIRIWDNFDSKSLISITTSHSDTELVMFTSNGKRILANSDSYYTQIWDADSGEFLESIGTEAEDVSDVTFSPGGHYIARGMDSGSIEIWSSDSKEHSVIRPEGAYHFGGGTQISSDGTRIATQWGSNMLIWDANRGVLLKVFDGQQGHQEILMGFSPDGKTVMTISTVVRIWDINGSMATKGLEDAHDNVSLLIPSPDNLLLASALKNSGVIYLWDVETGICQQTLRGHTGIPTVLAFSPDSSHLASSSRDGIIMIWRLESSSSVCTRTLKAHSNPTVSISFSPDGHNLASGDSKGTIKIFEVDSGTCAQEIAAEGLWVDSVAYSPDGRYLVSALKTGKVSVWDVDTGSAQMSFWSQACPSDSVSVSPGRVSFSSDSQHIVFGGYGTWVTIWHVDGTHVRTLKPQTSSNLNPITPYILDPNMPDHYEYDVDKEGWVIWRGARMLWLPITFRSFQLAVVSDTLAIAGSRGKILFLKFSD